MKIIKTKFNGLFLIKRKDFKDNRGGLTEVFKKNFFAKNYVFEYFTYSKKNVLRGLHFQINKQQEKYISVLYGKVFDVCVDLRKNSKTFGKVFTTILSKKNCKSILIPKGFAHGFLALEEGSIMYYLNSEYYYKNDECGILWNDLNLNIDWPFNKPILSTKDKKNITLNKFIEKYGSL